MLLGPGASAVNAAGTAVVDWGSGAYQSQYQPAAGAYGGTFLVRGSGISALTEQIPPSGYDFVTFCIQVNQHFSPGQVYDYEITNHTNHSTNYALDTKAAWLFHQWNMKTGVLTGMDYSAQSIKDLQLAIWASQLPSTGLAANLSDAGYVNAKVWYDQAVAAAPTDTGGVKVMNLVSRDINGNVVSDWQDQLVETPEPASMGMLLLGCCTLPLPLLRRFRKVS